MDSFEFNKIFGAITGALAAFLGVGFVVHAMFSDGHSGHHETLAFAVPVEGREVEDDEPELVIPFEVLLASADAGVGERLFRACSSCHSVDDGGANGAGPALWGVVGRPIGSVSDFGYSPALGGREDLWDFSALNGFIENPSVWATGTQMAYGGMPDAEDRAALIAYLNAQSSAPLALPTEEEAAAIMEALLAEQAAATEGDGESDADGEDETAE